MSGLQLQKRDGVVQPVVFFQTPEHHAKALHLAIHYHNLCCDLYEIIEMFCADAEAQETAK